MKKLLLTVVSVAMVSFAAYSSLKTNEDVSLSDLAMENAEALADDDINPLCPTGCLDKPADFCLCNGIIYKLERPKEKPDIPEENDN